MSFFFLYRLHTESVQYFQFDKEGNMYVFEPGAGFSGESVWVEPGFEVNVMQNWFSTLKSAGDISTQNDARSVNVSDVAISSSCPDVTELKPVASKRLILVCYVFNFIVLLFGYVFVDQ